MFETLSHLALQQYWWVIISLLGAALVFLMFIQGGQTLLRQIGKTEVQRDMIINTLGRKWELGFTTLVVFGGALFASFPPFYATSFGGAYWAWILILFSYIIQAISYEFRKKPGNFLGQKTYETFLFINGMLGTILIGAMVGSFFTGSEFSVDPMRMTSTIGATTIARWENTTHGLEILANLQNILLGLSVFFLARIQGALYVIQTIDDSTIFKKARRQVLFNGLPFLGVFIGFMAMLLSSPGYAIDPQTQEVYMESYKYLHNLLEMPVVGLLFLIGVLAVITGIALTVFKGSTNGIWPVGAGTVLTVFALFLVAGFNNTSFYPSTFDLQSSLTIRNASSSRYTLTAMSYVSLLVPVVIGYIWYVWRSMNKQKITAEEMETGEHNY
ncbi:MAG TPA: cytochrome d ubiquinol oxidase subunit II [Bacteroidales bacterium]|nr:cytochrome d ubiquinol oxidase subunit II [Bacteroidales bacterium]